MPDTLFINATIATVSGALIRDGALVIKGGKIGWLGRMKDLDDKSEAKTVLDCAGRLLTPALIDCHTHLVFAGERAGEWSVRLKGASYEDIAKVEGGILSTVKATREAELGELTYLAMERAKTLMAEGVGVIEIKSGYGLDFDNEIKCLRASAQVGIGLPVRVSKTFLGAHALPPEFKGNSSGYLDLLINDLLPAITKDNLADAVDAYQEGIAFSAEDVSRLFEAAKKHGLPVKLHADQLSDTNGAATAAKFGALSADHLEYANQAGIKAMAGAGTVAVLLPGAFYFLGETQRPPIEMFRKLKVPIAVATDCNPGTSPALSLRLMMNMACTLFGLTPDEALTGVTLNAAKALGLDQELGSLEVGKSASVVLWDTDNPAALCYWLGGNLLEALYLEGQPVIASA
ncbi:MAG: imidazolonepropionase [Proteobacteria bacterium]|nr:imidazolonepropionase [Pseudomonadota bacterium]